MNTEEEKINYHVNHRNRVKSNFLRFGLDGFTDEQALELLLFYSVARKDTRPIAEELIKTFGSLSSVFDADVKALANINGISEHTACFLKIIPQISNRYHSSRVSKIRKIPGTKEAGDYLVERYKNIAIERVSILTLDNSNGIRGFHVVSNGSEIAAELSPRTIAELCLKDNAVGVILAHNHPDGNLTPSDEDVRTTEFIKNVLAALEVKLIDHIIVTQNEYLSFSEKKLL